MGSHQQQQWPGGPPPRPGYPNQQPGSQSSSGKNSFDICFCLFLVHDLVARSILDRWQRSVHGGRICSLLRMSMPAGLNPGMQRPYIPGAQGIRPAGGVAQPSPGENLSQMVSW